VRASNAIRHRALVPSRKYAQLDWVRCLVGLRVVALGEARPQQLVPAGARDFRPVHWHLIGHLQRNKVRSVLPQMTLLHSPTACDCSNL